MPRVELTASSVLSSTQKDAKNTKSLIRLQHNSISLGGPHSCDVILQRSHQKEDKDPGKTSQTKKKNAASSSQSKKKLLESPSGKNNSAAATTIETSSMACPAATSFTLLREGENGRAHIAPTWNDGLSFTQRFADRKQNHDGNLDQRRRQRSSVSDSDVDDDKIYLHTKKKMSQRTSRAAVVERGQDDVRSIVFSKAKQEQMIKFLTS